jgi:hypothetical protein
VLIFLAAPGSTSSSEDDPVEMSSLPHLIVAVDLRKAFGSTDYYHLQLLIYSDTTKDIISLIVEAGLSRDAVTAGKKKQTKLLPPITSVIGTPLRATAVVRQMVHMQDSTGTKWSHVINFIITNNTHYNMVLGVAWLQR